MTPGQEIGLVHLVVNTILLHGLFAGNVTLEKMAQLQLPVKAEMNQL